MPARMPRRPSRSIPGGPDRGVALAIGAALISGLAIYLNAFAVKQVPDAAVYTTLKNGVAAAVLGGILIARGGASDVRAIDRRHWPAVLSVAVVGGSVPFVLFFTGLAAASAPSAAFIQKTLFIWVAFLAVPFLGETLGIATLAGLGLLVAGQVLVLPPAGIVWGTGETLILAATLLWAVETVLVRRLLAEVPSGTMAALRMGLGATILVGYLALSAKLGLVSGLSLPQWGWILVTGGILAGYVATWFAALQRAPASVVTSVLTLGVVVTGALTAVSRGSAPSAGIVLGDLLIVIASVILVWWSRATAMRLSAGSRAEEPLGARGA